MKNIDKIELEFMNRHKSNVNLVRKQFAKYVEDRLRIIKLWELVEFRNEPNWDLQFPLYDYDATHESSYIQALEHFVPSCEYILSFDNVVEQLFTWSDFDQSDHKAFDYIKVPFWKFPLVYDMTFNQLKYTREDLKPLLQKFYTQFYDCLRQLFVMSFLTENHEKIIAIIQDKIMSLKLPIQQAIDNSLYISQLRNKTQGDADLTFNLGITSAETLVDYYQRAEMIEPYVASEIKDRLKRKMNLDATCVFSYVTGTKSEEEGG